MLIRFASLDCGAAFGVGIQVRGKRRAWQFRNPFYRLLNPIAPNAYEIRP